jgi:hypothetical protein
MVRRGFEIVSTTTLAVIGFFAGSMAIAQSAPAESAPTQSALAQSAPAQSALPTDPRLTGAARAEKAGWIQVRLAGPPEMIGYQHGYLLAPEIGELLSVIKPYLEKSTKRDWNFYRTASEQMLWPRIDPEYQREIDGIVAGLKAAGGKADRWDIVALNANQELPYYYVPWLDKREGKQPTSHAPGNCSAFIATGQYTKDGRIVMGHNAWTNYVTGTRWNIIFDIRPERGARMLMDGLPGVIVSDDDFGINSLGIMITETTITQFEGWDPMGKPEFVRARKALQYSRSIDDVVRIMLDGNNGGYANDWLIGDNKTGEIALFELGLVNHSVRRTHDGCFFGANFPDSEKLIREETKFDVKKADSSPNARKARWGQLMAKHRGKIDIEIAKAMETDLHDVTTGKDDASERALAGHVEDSPRGVPEWDWGPFFPGGTTQAKVVDAQMTERMAFWARFGHVGSNFRAADFLAKRPDYAWMRGLIRDLILEPWTVFDASETPVAIRDRAPASR